MFDMVQLSKGNEDIAVVLYDQFRHIGNVLSGLMYALEMRAREAGDEVRTRVFWQEYEGLRDVIDSTDPSDVDTQARLMDEWRGLIHALRAV